MPAPVFRDCLSLSAVIERDRRQWVADGNTFYRLVMTSGYFDPPHPGHLACLREAKRLGTHLLVVVNGDAAAARKKGFSFMDEDDRADLAAEFRSTDYVLVWGGSDVEGVIRTVRPDCFAKGGSDRSDITDLDGSEVQACFDVKCVVALGVGGSDKKRSSSDLVRRAASLLTQKPSP